VLRIWQEPNKIDVPILNMRCCSFLGCIIDSIKLGKYRTISHMVTGEGSQIAPFRFLKQFVRCDVLVVLRDNCKTSAARNFSSPIRQRKCRRAITWCLEHQRTISVGIPLLPLFPASPRTIANPRRNDSPFTNKTDINGSSRVLKL
jgi:hypothetical protein